MTKIYIWGDNGIKIEKKLKDVDDKKLYGDGELFKFLNQLKLIDKEHTIQVWTKQ